MLNRFDELLTKLKDIDQDIRSMAISDILELLRTSRNKLSRAEGEQCTEAFIKLLSDTQSHVQNLAAECLDQVVHLIEEDTIRKAVLEICTNIQKSGREAGGCALSVGLRRMTVRVVEELDDKAVLGSLATPIVTVLQNTPELPSDVMIDIFGALSEVLTHAGPQIGADSNAVSQTQELLFKFIGSSNVAVRRRAIAALGAFVVHVPGARSEEALDEIYQRYKSCTQDSDKCILLRVLVAIAQQRPARVAKLVPTIVDTEIGAVGESERELHVTLLFMFETFVRRCTELVADKCDEIYHIAADAVRFDPNYSYSDDEGMDTSSEGGLDNDFGDDSDGDAFEDDEDDSWDVRLGGVKLLSAIAKSGLLYPSDVVNRIGGVLLKSFREREDVVRAEIMLTYAAVVEELQKEEAASNSGVVDALREQAPKVVAAVLSAIKSYPKSTETKQLAFVIFARLAAANRGILDSSLTDIASLASSALAAEDTSGMMRTASTSLVKTNLKLDVLEFMHVLVAHSTLSDEVEQFFATEKDEIRKNVESKTFQVPATALDVAAELVVLLRTAAEKSLWDIAQFIPWAEDMAQCAIPLTGADDQNLKGSALDFVGTLLQQLGNRLSPSAVEKQLEALTVVKGGSGDLRRVLGALVRAIARPTALSREKIVEAAPGFLQLVKPLLSQYSAAVTAAALDVVSAIAEYGADALTDNSNQILQSVIAVIDKTPDAPPPSALRALAAVCPSVSEANIQMMISDLIKQLSTATVYDGQSTEALGELFRAIGRTFPGLTKICSDEISDGWQQAYIEYARRRKNTNNDVIQVQFPSSSLKNAANSINALYEGYFEAQGSPWTSEYLSKMIRTAPRTTAEIGLTCLGLRALGYAAQKDALAQDSEQTAQLFAQAGSRNEDVRREAADALGSYVGSHPSMFSALFSSSTDDSEGSDLCRLSKLEAVRVATDRIIGTSRDKASAGSMWKQITGYVQSNQGSLPDSLVQSLATIVAIFPETYAVPLAEYISSPDNSTEVRAFYITTFRTVLADKQLSTECDEQIKRVLTTVMAGIDDSSAEIRRLSLLALQTVIQDKAALVESALTTIAPALFQQTVIDESLVRTIRMGPFQRRVDDGLDARRAAYQCVQALVHALPGTAEGSAVVDSVVRGIADEQEIRLVVLQIINESLPMLFGEYMARLDSLAESIEKAQGTVMPKKPVKQEIEKHNAMLRSTVALLVALEPVADAVSPKSAVFSKLQEKLWIREAIGPSQCITKSWFPTIFDCCER